MKCTNCKYIEKFDQDTQKIFKKECDSFYGFCRRHSPILLNYARSFPIVHSFDWCGDFEEKT